MTRVAPGWLHPPTGLDGALMKPGPTPQTDANPRPKAEGRQHLTRPYDGFSTNEASCRRQCRRQEAFLSK